MGSRSHNETISSFFIFKTGLSRNLDKNAFINAGILYRTVRDTIGVEPREKKSYRGIFRYGTVAFSHGSDAF
jgi:hypothetical protein